MADTANSPAKTPWHLWTVGALSLLWNAVGVVDFTMTQTKNESYMSAFTPAQLEYFYGFPIWVVLAWGIATWGSALGSVLLLMRRKLAVLTNLVVLGAMAITFVHNLILTDGMKIMGGIGPLVFTLVIVAIGVLLYFYARAMARRGVLH